MAPAPPRPAPRRAVDSRIDDDYSDFDLNAAGTPPEDADYVFPGALVQARDEYGQWYVCLLYTSPSPRDKRQSRMPSSA